MKGIFHLVIPLLATSLAMTAWAQPAQPPPAFAARLPQVEPYVEQEQRRQRIPGLVIGIAMGDSRWTRAFGLSDLENGTPMVEQSAFRVASVTKPMTAVAVMQLVERGLLDLDAPIQRYVPYFPVKQWPVTLRGLLGHLAGITDYRGAAEERLTVPKTTREAIAIFEEAPLVFEPGTDFYYSSYGYNLVGAAIEEASGLSYGEYMRARVWVPLGMTAIRVDDPAALIPHRVRGYRMVNDRTLNADFVDISSRIPAGGTRGTVRDLLEFGRAMYRRELLEPASYDAMWSRGRLNDGRPTRYGLGWDLSPHEGAFAVAHTGSQQETATVLNVYPTRQVAVAVMANLERADVDAIARGVFRLLTDESQSPKPYVAATGERGPVIDALQAAFADGRATFERLGQPAITDTTALRRAFSEWHATLLGTRRASPMGVDVLSTVGSYVAARLRASSEFGSDSLRRYSAQGAIGFFADYARLR